MASHSVPKPYADLSFTRLSPVSYIYQPSSTSTTLSTSPSPSAPAPSLILFPSWMSAAPRHACKYLSTYRTLYPHTPIITITYTLANSFLASTSRKQAWYGPIVDFLATLPGDANILLHSVSNGGAFSVVNVAQLYRQRTGKPLPIRAQVLDSSPGEPSFRSDINAVVVGLPPNFLIRLLARVFLTLFSGFGRLVLVLSRRKHMVDEVRERLNDERLFGKARRVYVYSREDAMVGWRAVERHIGEARGKGWEARGEEWKGSKHVAHMVMDPDRYWAVVQRNWEESFGENTT